MLQALDGFRVDLDDAAPTHGYEQDCDREQSADPPCGVALGGRRGDADATGMPAGYVVGAGTRGIWPGEDLPWAVDVGDRDQFVLAGGDVNASGFAMGGGDVHTIECPADLHVDVSDDAHGPRGVHDGVDHQHGGDDEVHGMTVKLVP